MRERSLGGTGMSERGGGKNSANWPGSVLLPHDLLLSGHIISNV